MQKNKIHILFLIPSLSLGGAEVQLLELVKGLDKRKFDITVGVFYSNGQLSADFLSVTDIDVLFFGKKHEFDFRWIQHLWSFLRTHKVDVIDMWNTSAKSIGMLSAWIFSIKHKVIRERTAHTLYSSPGSVFYTFLDRILGRYASIVIANSNAGQRFAIEKGFKPEKTHVIYNSINDKHMIPQSSGRRIRASFDIADRTQVVGMVARLIEDKDPITFLHAARQILLAKPKVRFLLVGNGPLFNASQEMAKKLGIFDSVVFTGERKDIPDLLNIMDIVVLSSSTTEGCSNSIMEAMYMGKPVVATNVGGNPELVADGQTGFLVPPQNPNEMAKAILTLLDDSNLALQMGLHARQQANQRFSSNHNIKKNELVYKRLDNYKKNKNQYRGRF